MILMVSAEDITMWQCPLILLVAFPYILILNNFFDTIVLKIILVFKPCLPTFAGDLVLSQVIAE